MVLVRSAYFQSCTCGHSGWVVIATGAVSPRCYSKEDGLMFLEGGLKTGEITPDEGKIIRQQIEDSPMARYTTLAMRIQMIYEEGLMEHLEGTKFEPVELPQLDCASPGEKVH